MCPTMYHGISHGWLTGWLTKSGCDLLSGKAVEAGFVWVNTYTHAVVFIWVLPLVLC